MNFNERAPARSPTPFEKKIVAILEAKTREELDAASAIEAPPPPELSAPTLKVCYPCAVSEHEHESAAEAAACIEAGGVAGQIVRRR